MPATTVSPARALNHWLSGEALAQGFDAVAVAPAASPGTSASDLDAYVKKGYHGTMDWLADTMSRRRSPQSLWPDARSVIVFAINYGPEENPLAVLEQRDHAAISVYARNRDYHDVIKGRLKTIASRFAARTGAEVKVFVDTAPVMEKPLAQASGLGWQGKHTNLVSRVHGSWLFLGSIFTTAVVEPDEPETDHCGSCRACLDVCPTDAFPEAYRIDARRCISYLTIEHKEQIPREFREPMGNRIYGCDDCLAVCPWNKFARTAREAKLKARDDLRAPALAELLVLDDAGFRALFSSSPIKRIGRDRFIRNCLIAAGNSRNSSLAKICRSHLSDASPLVRGAAVWALSRLLNTPEFVSLFENKAGSEKDDAVSEEWSAARTTMIHRIGTVR